MRERKNVKVIYLDGKQKLSNWLILLISDIPNKFIDNGLI